jgi:hypothetical protein
VADDRPGITPADDPYEFDWPDDAKEERAAEREKAAAAATVRPAPLLLSAVVIGTGVVLAFVLPVAIVAGALQFFIAVTAPIVIGGVVVALLPAVLLERVSRGWRRGFPQAAFLALGLVVGGGWTWLVMTVFDAAPPDRVRAATFMATAVAAGFYAAYTWAESFRRFPRYVYVLSAVIGFLTLASIGNYVLFVLG